MPVCGQYSGTLFVMKRCFYSGFSIQISGKDLPVEVLRSPFILAVERESGPVVGHTLVGARVLRCPHFGEHDAITAVLLVAGPGQGVRRERGPVAP